MRVYDHRRAIDGFGFCMAVEKPQRFGQCQIHLDYRRSSGNSPPGVLFSLVVLGFPNIQIGERVIGFRMIREGFYGASEGALRIPQLTHAFIAKPEIHRCIGMRRIECQGFFI